jgi:hypothetical protein
VKPRDFINFFKTRSGKLVAFAALFGGGLVLFSVFRGRSHKTGELDASVARPNQADKPQVIQSIERPMQPFYPPPPKPDQVQTTLPSGSRAPLEYRPQEPSGRTLAPISLFADAVATGVERKPIGSVYAPYGRLISCETVITVDSASIQTPIVGLITENVYHAGKLVIPAGTEVHGTAQTDHERERIASGGSWTLVWQTGEELHLKAIALDREFSGNQEGWGITDGSAGLRGQIIKSDDLAEIKLFAATFLSGAADALTEKQQTVFGPISSPSLNNAPFEGAQKVLSEYAQRIYDAVQRDGFYVRVPSGKQFYLYVLQTIDRADAAIGGSTVPFAEENEPKPETHREPAAPVTMPGVRPSRSSPIIQP